MIPFEYKSIFTFADKYYVAEKDGLCRILDNDGKLIIAPLYQRLQTFGSRYAKVELGSKHGIIDFINGQVVIPCIDEYIDEFSENLFLVRKVVKDDN